MNMSLPVPRATIESIVKARARSLSSIAEAAELIRQGYEMSRQAVEEAHSARQGGRAMPHDVKAREHLFQSEFDPVKSLKAYRRQLDADIWTHLLQTTGMTDMMDRTAKEEFTTSLMNEVPEADYDNITATIQGLFGNVELIFQRGLAKGFSKLDKRFKSHDGFKIGSRIIMERMFDEWGDPTYGGNWDTLQDIERVFAVLDKEKPAYHGLRETIREDRGSYKGARQAETEAPYFRIKSFKNGNAHLWFTRDDLVQKANKILADYYGEVLPDAATINEKPTGTAVSTKLQFYATPSAAAQQLVWNLNFKEGCTVLEPSAGEGALLRVIPAGCQVTAVEVHPVRAAYVGAICANFLTWAGPTDHFDIILMNPPFADKHWMDHVRKAVTHLKPGGTLRAILPASAEVNETTKHIAFREWASKLNRREHWRMWTDLPPESFASSGTNIATVILELKK